MKLIVDCHFVFDFGIWQIVFNITLFSWNNNTGNKNNWQHCTARKQLSCQPDCILSTQLKTQQEAQKLAVDQWPLHCTAAAQARVFGPVTVQLQCSSAVSASDHTTVRTAQRAMSCQWMEIFSLLKSRYKLVKIIPITHISFNLNTYFNPKTSHG